MRVGHYVAKGDNDDENEFRCALYQMLRICCLTWIVCLFASTGSKKNEGMSFTSKIDMSRRKQSTKNIYGNTKYKRSVLTR